jgi:hypothetical protein
MANGFDTPVTRQNYLKVAGYVDEPDPESEAMLPAELQLKGSAEQE